MPLVPFTAGQKLTAAALNAAFDVTRITHAGGDQIVTNSTTFEASTELTLPVKANASYIFELLLEFTATTTADVKWQLAVPTGTFVRTTLETGVPVSNTANSSEVWIHAIDDNGSTTSGLGTGTIVQTQPSGLLIISSTAGDATVEFAQNTAEASDCTLKGGSFIRLTQVA